MMDTKLELFQERIGYSFNDKNLLRTALTHSSFVKGSHEHRRDNERLEFLGDAVLGLCVGEQIYRTFDGVSEGIMSRARANAVCEAALYEAAKKLGIPDVILLSYGETVSGGKDKPSILSDAVEALIGAIYLDGGLEAARTFILSFTDVRLSFNASKRKDDKTQLQEYVQERHMGNISYDVVDIKGPDHKRIFTIEVKINDIVYGKGTGYSKHEAGRNAAAQALTVLERLSSKKTQSTDKE